MAKSKDNIIRIHGYLDNIIRIHGYLDNMLKKILYILTALMVLVSIYLLLFIAPVPVAKDSPAADINDYKIFYFHVPIAASAYVAFTIVFISGVMYLKSKKQKWDIIGLSAAEVGIIFAALTLLTGSLWGKSAWGTYWNPADVRLNTYMILFLTYLAYLMIRSNIDEPEKRARLSAVFGIVGYITVPLSYFSIIVVSQTVGNISQTHPNPAEVTFGTLILRIFFINLIAFILLCLSLIFVRKEIENLKEEIVQIKQNKILDH